MYKIMIVDDEPIVRLGFKSIIDWEAFGISIPYEASNGKQAFAIFQKNQDIDLIITDINMPIMNGLEFIEKINESDRKPGLLVLSAYDDYDLLRKAFKLGIHDYILKYNMQADDLLELVKKTLDTIEPAVSKPSTQHLGKAKKHFLHSLIQGTVDDDIKATAQSLNTRLVNRSLVAVSMHVDDYSKLKKQYENGSLTTLLTSIGNAIEQVLIETNSGEVIALSPEQYAILMSFEAPSELLIRNQLITVLNKIKNYLNTYLDIQVSMGISSIGTSLSEVSTLHQQAEKNVHLRYLLGKGRLIFSEHGINITQLPHTSIYGIARNMLEKLDELDRTGMKDKLEDLLHTIQHFQANTLSDLIGEYSKVIILINNYLIDQKIDVDTFMGQDTNVYTVMEQFDTSEEIHNWIKQYATKVFDTLNEKHNCYENPIIRKAKKYIHENYRQKLSLEEVCNYLDINMSYFSSLFSQEMDMTYSMYLTQVRIETAKELLRTTTNKIYDICELSGYSSTEHFSRVFKKTTGLSPNQYRRKNT